MKATLHLFLPQILKLSAQDAARLASTLARCTTRIGLRASDNNFERSSEGSPASPAGDPHSRSGVVGLFLHALPEADTYAGLQIGYAVVAELIEQARGRDAGGLDNCKTASPRLDFPVPMIGERSVCTLTSISTPPMQRFFLSTRSGNRILRSIFT
jgi:hypothetical protein